MASDMPPISQYLFGSDGLGNHYDQVNLRIRGCPSIDRASNWKVELPERCGIQFKSSSVPDFKTILGQGAVRTQNSNISLHRSGQSNATDLLNRDLLVGNAHAPKVLMTR